MARILVADDDPSITQLLVKVLTSAGHVAESSSSGVDTLRKIGLRPDDPSVEVPDLVVLDIMMPKLDGYSVGQVIRSHPRTRAVPILAISALRELSRLFTATVQVQGFLNKPFPPDEFLACVTEILERSRPAA